MTKWFWPALLPEANDPDGLRQAWRRRLSHRLSAANCTDVAAAWGWMRLRRISRTRQLRSLAPTAAVRITSARQAAMMFDAFADM